MKNFLLKPFIEQFRKGDMTTFPMVYANFKKLIFFYAKHLRYEDAAEDITLFFIELLYVLNLSKFRSDDSESLERYIAVCLRISIFLWLKNLQNDCKTYSRFMKKQYRFTNCMMKK